MNLQQKLHRMTTKIIATDDFLREPRHGTGFFYAEHDEAGNKQKLWVVTNRHVVRPTSQGDTGTGPDFAAGEIEVGYRTSDKEPEWRTIPLKGEETEEMVKLHPDRNIDVAAIDVTELLDGPYGDYQFPMEEKLFADNQPELQVEAASDVLIVGYPERFYDQENVFPIVKRGIIASGWGLHFGNQEQHNGERHRKGPYFMVDAKMFPGSSGSVVISKPQKIGDETAKRFAFLGVVSHTAPVDLCRVWYAETVLETIRGN